MKGRYLGEKSRGMYGLTLENMHLLLEIEFEILSFSTETPDVSDIARLFFFVTKSVDAKSSKKKNEWVPKIKMPKFIENEDRRDFWLQRMQRDICCLVVLMEDICCLISFLFSSSRRRKRRKHEC